MFEVKSCCVCCSLRTGTIIIGTLQIIFSIIMVVLGLNIKWELVTSVDPDTVKIFYTISVCITIIIGILLLVGVFKRNTCMMLSWLVQGQIGAVFELLNAICKLIVCIVKDDWRACFAPFFGSFVVLMIYTYLWLVVYSYFKQVKSETMNNHQQQP